MKKLYGIGTGPGDPDLLTLKAVKAIEDSCIIFAPSNKGKNMAVDTARDFIGKKKIMYIDFPMGQVTGEDYTIAADKIINNIPEGGTGSYLTIGDPMIYSTFIYIMDELNDKEIDIEIVPGIPSFVASAAAMRVPLTLKGDNFILCDSFDDELLAKSNSMAILKAFGNKDKILKKLEEKNFNYKYIVKATLEEEKIIEDKEEIIKDKNYMSLILARKE